MPKKFHIVSGHQSTLLRLILYLLFLLMGLLLLLNITVNRKGIINTENLGQNEGNVANGILYQRHSYPGNIRENKAVRNPNGCNFEDYILRQRVTQTDPCLIATVKKKIILSPPPASQLNTSKLTTKEEIPSNVEKFKWIEKLLIKDNKNDDARWPGFFIECGANDGKFISPTIRLERNYDWTGLLVEANPTPFKKLKERKRNAWAANVAACTTEYPDQLTFYTNPADLSTGIAGLNARPKHRITANLTVQCIPLYTMLAALEITTVDYLSLDVEGFELAVLKTIPFHKIQFKVMTIEYSLIPGKQEALRKFLEPKGYRFVKEIHDYLTEDCLYVHESLYKKASTVKL